MNQLASISSSLPSCDHIFQNILGNQRKGNLYLGAIQAVSKENLVNLNIRAVLTLLRYDQSLEKAIQDLIAESIIQKFLWVQVKDSPEQDLYSYFQKTHDFITENLQHGNVLVHCLKGGSRSATIVVSYLMHGLGINFEEAFDFVEKQREMINPNEGFIEQLKKFDQKLEKDKSHRFSRQLLNSSQIFKDKIYQQIHYCKHIHSFHSKDNSYSGNLFIGNQSSLSSNVLNYFSITLWVQIKGKDIENNEEIQDPYSLLTINKKQGSSGEHQNTISQIKCHSAQQFHDIIKHQLQFGNVLFQCENGFSYSPVLAATFLAHQKNVQIEECLKYILTKKPICTPSDNYLHLLQK